MKLNVIDLIATDLNDLLDKIDGRKIKLDSKEVVLHTKNSPHIIRKGLSFSEKFLNAISNPNIAYILMMLGMIGLIFEFSHPGIAFPGIAGLICLILAFYSFNTLPVNYTGFILIILSFILFIAEFFTSAFGLLTLSGIICLVIGSMMLIDSDYPFFRISIQVIISTSLCIGFITLILVYKVLRSFKFKVATGKEEMIGLIVKAQTDINPEGKVFCHGEIWNAVSVNDQDIVKGTPAEIVDIKGLTLIVKQYDKK